MILSAPSLGAALEAITGATSTNITTICAVGLVGKVIESNDYGKNWTTNTTLSPTDLYGLDIVGNRLWVAGNSGSTAKAYFSDDWGANWTDTAGLTSVCVMDIAFNNSTNPLNGVVAESTASRGMPGGGSMYYTTNSGSPWNFSTFIGSPTTFYGVAFSGTTDIYWGVGYSANVWKSSNGGNIWDKISVSGLGSETLTDVYFVDPNHGFITGLNKTFLYTSDGGANWIVKTDVGDSNNGVYFMSPTTGWICTGSGKIFQLKINYSTNTVTSTQLTPKEVYSPSPLVDPTKIPTILNRIFALDEYNIFSVCNDGSVYAAITPLSISSTLTKSTGSDKVAAGFSGDLIITGTNFRIGNWPKENVTFSGTGNNSITVNSVTRNNASQLTVNVITNSSASTNTQTVTVKNVDNSSTATGGTFTVNALPKITNIEPSSGTQGTTLPLTVTGTGFQPNITANFGTGITNSITDRSSIQLKINVNIDSAAATGPRAVTFTNPDGGTVNSSFTVSSATANNPIIDTVTPSSLTQSASNQDLIISGSNFEANATTAFSNDGITINSTTFNSASQLTVNISVSANATPGPRSLTITNPPPPAGTGGAGSKNSVLYITAAGVIIINPTITSSDPPSVYRGTPQTIHILGSGFQNGATVSFSPASDIIINNINFINSSQLDVMLTISPSPIIAARDTRDIIVSNPDGGHGTLANGLNIISQSDVAVVTSAVFYPNPYNPGSGSPGTIQFFITRNALVEIVLVDISGKQIMGFSTNATVGYNKLRWDGTDYNGEKIANGVILALFKINGNLQKQKLKIMLKN